jgi:hypothetical protein
LVLDRAWIAIGSLGRESMGRGQSSLSPMSRNIASTRTIDKMFQGIFFSLMLSPSVCIVDKNTNYQNVHEMCLNRMMVLHEKLRVIKFNLCWFSHILARKQTVEQLSWEYIFLQACFYRYRAICRVLLWLTVLRWFVIGLDMNHGEIHKQPSPHWSDLSPWRNELNMWHWPLKEYIDQESSWLKSMSVIRQDGVWTLLQEETLGIDVVFFTHRS